jgi:NAD(P)-dependent dehydrogenase (short-subunit alcohol dehydrogenase family)
LLLSGGSRGTGRAIVQTLAEVASLALHLASAASSFTTGAIIRVDGGITRKV